MGGKFCKELHSQSTKSSSLNDDDDHQESNSNQGSSLVLMNLIKLDCLNANDLTKKRKEKKKRSEQCDSQEVKKRKRTLEEWLLDSPAFNLRSGHHHYFKGSELYVLKQFSKRVHPSSSSSIILQYNSTTVVDELPVEIFSTDISCSSMQSTTSSILRRNPSGRLVKKKVTFKQPEDTDVIIFHSSPE